MFKLAGHLGKTVSQLENELSYNELIEWQAYDRIDPIGAVRQDLQTAHLLYTYYRSMSGDDSVSVSDFLPVNPNPLTDEEQQLLEEQKHQAELDACMARLIAGLEAKD